MSSAICAPYTSTPYPKPTHFLARPVAPTSLRVFASSSSSSSSPDPNGAKLEYTPWLVVGLGNPGNKYYGTRHNVGFEMIDKISEKEGILLNTIQSKALIGIERDGSSEQLIAIFELSSYAVSGAGAIGEVPILLAKPQAYMNYSGESVYDEMSLPNGVLRLQPKGGHGHHNGVKNVMGHLDGRKGFPRLSIGIGNPPGTMDMRAFLLQRFSPAERKQIDAALEQGVEAVRTLVHNGFNDSITRFNLGQKYKYHKV
ncbi:hypothetical protein Cgig2_029880 [Carnegiea gigantea]|uniref:Chloroplastic group IIB intron splicing facilitator CRS2, chloroplastic n=1 Tax=Carnegiea gigantea TaxID=171969 RepID=A0A9Q1QCH3_9CARY|nr:hypothetical protein Cgig2_029880 [Carnegiea gigantea]